MKPKTVKCKAKGCRERFVPRFNGHAWCSNECRDVVARQIFEKANKGVKKAVKKELAEMKDKTKSHGDWEAHLERLCREIVRLIDKTWNCISCGRPVGGFPFHASHRHSVGANPTLRYNLLNLFNSCNQCNTHHNGSPDGYDEGIKALYGDEMMNYIKFDIVKDNPYLGLSIPELKEKIVIANKILKQLKSDNRAYSASERLDMRKDFNDMLAIYK